MGAPERRLTTTRRSAAPRRLTTPRRFTATRRLTTSRPAPAFALLCALAAATGCATSPPATAPAPGNDSEPPPSQAFDPVGRYSLTMSSETMVSEGSMEIRGEPGRHSGVIDIGSAPARILSVEVGDDHMNVRADMRRQTLILRLARDGDFLSGNWVLGVQRGTAVARKLD